MRCAHVHTPAGAARVARARQAAELPARSPQRRSPPATRSSTTAGSPAACRRSAPRDSGVDFVISLR
eukprot:13076524-Alexandrium_andersonii.AAC.1